MDAQRAVDRALRGKLPAGIPPVLVERYWAERMGFPRVYFRLRWVTDAYAEATVAGLRRWDDPVATFLVSAIAAATADEDDDAIAPRSVTVPADTRIQATGKRKSAVARVIVRAGDGSFQINDRGIEEYFKSSQHQALARQPLVTAGYEGSVDVRVRVHGGGISGQAGAVRHGVARALTALEPELRGDLKRRGMLTRDDRRKERKKAGLKKARKRPQFSKR